MLSLGVTSPNVVSSTASMRVNLGCDTANLPHIVSLLAVQQFVQIVGDDAPYSEFLAVMKFDWLEVRIFRQQADNLASLVKSLDRKVVINHRQYNVIVFGINRLVHDDGIAFKYPDTSHRISGNAE